MARLLSEALLNTLFEKPEYMEEKSYNTIKTNRHLIRKKAKEAIQDLIQIAQNVKDKDVPEIFDRLELSKLIYNVMIRLDADQRDREYPDMFFVAMEEAINAGGRGEGRKRSPCKIKIEFAPDDSIRKRFHAGLLVDAI